MSTDGQDICRTPTRRMNDRVTRKRPKHIVIGYDNGTVRLGPKLLTVPNGGPTDGWQTQKRLVGWLAGWQHKDRTGVCVCVPVYLCAFGGRCVLDDVVDDRREIGHAQQ